jgi:hypothetical protein
MRKSEMRETNVRGVGQKANIRFVLFGELGKKTMCTIMHRWDDNISMNFKVKAWEGICFIHVSHHKGICCGLLCTRQRTLDFHKIRNS